MHNEVREALFARVFLLAHHPFLVSGTKQETFSSEWNHIKARFLSPAATEGADKKDADEEDEDEEKEEEETTDDRIDHLIEANDSIKQSIADLLASQSEGLLFSSIPAERMAAQRMLASLLNFAGNGEGESVALHNVIEDLLVKRIDEEQIGAVTDLEVNVFFTPFDELYVPKKKGEADADSGASSSKRRGGAGRRGNEDEQWEQQVREELEKKKALATKAKASYTSEEKTQLAQQQTLRTALKQKIQVVDYVLETIEVLAAVRPDELHPALPYLLRSFSVLFECAIFEKESGAALRSIAKAISPELLRHHYEDVADSLRVVLQLQLLDSRSEKTRVVTQMLDLFSRMLAGLMEYVFGFQFDSEADFDGDAPVNHVGPPTFHLIYPVLRTLIHLEPSLRHWALPLFAVHARMIPEEEEEEIGDVAAQRLLRKEMIVLTLFLLSQKAAGGCAPITNPDLEPMKLLTNLLLGPSLSSSEWAPLLGDDGLLSEFGEVRHAVLQALAQVAESDESEQLHSTSNPLLTSRLFFACFDTDTANQSIAKSIWDSTASELTRLFAGPLLVLLNHRHANVRESAALAIADGMKQFPETITPVINNLKSQFLSNLPKPLDTLDEFGIPKVRRAGQGEMKEEPQTYLPRCGVGLCLEKAVLVATFSKENVMDVMSFVIEHGLGDSNATVRTQMRKTGIQVVDAFGGGANTSQLLQVFEKFLDTKPSDDAKHEIYDHQREGVVVCLGALAKHMDKTDPKVSSIVDSLLEALSIPSESVQRSVAACLAPLIPAVKGRSTDIMDDLLVRTTTGETFGERIGAAFGVSAVVKGLGISALKQHDIIPRLEESMKTGGANARQGAMLVFECLSQRLGILFEPYIIVILPIMLKCSADASPQVRDAASQTAKGIMANLSAHGVKLVLPSLLRALEDSAWRTKQSGIQILGSMAYCAPRQLGSCLPQVVPKLMAALTDSHPKVRESGKSALRDIGSVVRNPEIASISSALLNALEDPNKFTPEALQQLQSTSFVHSIDAPSLALVMPIITRGLKDRGGDAKKKSALIVGSMCSMINDAKDLIPYMDMVLPSLKSQLMDPIPEVRAVAAKAMGKLVKGLGEKHFSDILAWLLDAMKGDFGSVERSGAAQGLCEVLVALGKDRVEATLFDEIFPLARHPKYSVREGVLWIIAFLPPAFGKGFSVFLGDALPIVVSGLSDEAESVRDVAMHAGHVVVNAHAISHTKDILPSLEAGLFDDSWRIRQSSVALLGDLMYRISGTRAVGLNESSGDFDDDDDAAGSAAGDKAIIKVLGMERRNAILASLYIIRSDTSAVVRQSALQVWKSVVANTPKTLRQILEALMTSIVNALSGSNVEKQTMAGRTLGEIVRKLGEHVLPEVVPILRSGLSPKNSSGMRQGVCIGLAEVIECSSKKLIEDYVDTLVDAVLDGLCDELPEVRNSAAQAFDVLQKSIGYRAIDETVPSLLQRIRSHDADAQERALLGLQEILRVKSREVLPYLIPRLLTTPVTPPAARAISRVAQATGAVIHLQIERIFGVFISQYVALSSTNPAVADAIKVSLRDVVLSVENPGVHWLAIELCKYCESEVVQERALAFYLIGEFCGHTKTQYNDQVALYLKQIVVHLNDTEGDVVQAASDAFKGMNATLRPEQLGDHIDFIRQSINTLVSDARHRKGGVGSTGEYLLPGLCIAKGLEPFLPSYQHALMNGTPELRQSAATGLGELVLLSSATALRPYLIKLTGPLIRIAGDRFPGHVKAAILQTLEILLTKGGVALKPFLPQLQTTFVKALNDTASEVRTRGATALSKLVALSPRVDPLIAELTEKLRTTTAGIREANLIAVSSIVETVGDKISAPVKSGLQDALLELLDSQEDTLRERASKCVANVVVASDADEGAASVLSIGLVDAAKSSAALAQLPWTRRHSACVFLEVVLQKNPEWIAGDVASQVASSLALLAADEHIAVRSTALKAIAALVKQNLAQADAFIPILVDGIKHPNKDVSKTAAKIVKRLAKKDPAATRAHSNVLVPAVFQIIKSNNIAVKITAERALLYLLEVQTRPETLATFVRGADAMEGKVIAEYARRVLTKLRPDSGDESE
uniref:TOG domain-containing protein n=1 Tax=Globisporangium ultimum (strain ATCC 200006 / CBS 805.95 / DAOM BR144) TaxID=431595 RepID=K3WKL7_GLOUD